MSNEIAVDIDDIRQRIVEFRESDDEYFDNWVSATTVELMCDETERLRARVTALELERSNFWKTYKDSETRYQTGAHDER